MSTPNLREDLNNYLAKSEKPPITAKFKSTLNSVKVTNWFNNINYTRVPTDENTPSNGWFSSTSKVENDCCPTLSRVQRITAFCICVTLGLIFFSLSALYMPVLLLKARKFSLLFTLGSLFMIFSFSFLWGPVNHLKHLFSYERLVFTSSYFGTLILTLYFALSVQSTPLTVLFAVLQVIALIWFLISYIPGGHTGLKFFTKLCSSAVTSSVSKTLPV